MASTKNEKASSSVPAPTSDSQLNRPMTPVDWTAPKSKAVVVGLYGIPGSGKTFLMHQLKQEFRQERFAFYESSELIDLAFPGGLTAFRNSDDETKDYWRKHAIDIIGKSSAVSGQVAVVSGHLGFWSDVKKAPDIVCTENDLHTYSHFIYLDTPAELVAERRRADKTRVDRPELSVSDLTQWQQAEKTKLRDLCRKHGILLYIVNPGPALLKNVSTLLRDFGCHTKEYNFSQAKSRLDELVFATQGQVETMLVLDADKTLAANDTGNMFWESMGKGSTLKDLFSSKLEYTYIAFRQAMLLYEEAAEKFDAICQKVALAVRLYSDMLSLLRLVAGKEHVGAVVVTSGLRHVWEMVLEREGLAKTVKVIGGGRISDGFVVTAAMKGALVAHLREHHHMYVWAFGDGPLDLEMFREADRAIVIVGDEQTRSKKMEKLLENAINDNCLQAHQALLPGTVSPRLNLTKLPPIKLTDQQFRDDILVRRGRSRGPQVLHATNKKAAKLLMTPTRDARVAGPALREAHAAIGRYLATEYLTDIIGLDEISIPHVQGKLTEGHQLRHERQTTIVALMRGGEPMALGVSDIFPLASFFHAKAPENIKPDLLKGQQTIVLVDSVVNSGDTVHNFVEHIHGLNDAVRIVVVAGVVQAGFIHGPKARLPQTYAVHKNLSVVALRLSENSFTGKGPTDTGHRLFNTTFLD